MKSNKVLIIILLMLSSLVVSAQTAVNLGLKMNWCSANVSDQVVASPESLGETYTWNQLSDISLPADWQLPTVDDMLDLCLKCTWVWTTYNNVTGYLITGETANSIFIPFTPLWTSTQSDFDPNLGSCLRVDSANHVAYGYEPIEHAFPVRLVTTNPEYKGEGIDPLLVGAEGYIVVHDNEVILRDFQPFTNVNIYTTSGASVASYTTGRDGCLRFSTASLPIGLYVINARHITYKMRKK